MLFAASSQEVSHGVPKVVWFQALNFSLFAGLLWFILKDKIKAYYKNRQSGFQEKFKAASYKKREALQSLKAFEKRLEDLLNTKEAQIEKAKKHAATSVQALLNQTEAQVQQIQQESKETIDRLHAKAYEELKQNVIRTAVETVKKDLKNISSKQHIELFNKYNKRVSNENI